MCLQIKEEQLEEAVCLICHEDKLLPFAIKEWFFHMIQQYMSSDVSPKFWKHFEEPVPADDITSVLHKSFDGLHCKVKKYINSVERLSIIHQYVAKYVDNFTLESNHVYDRDNLLTTVKAVVFYKVNKNFLDSVNSLYSQAFHCFDAAKKSNGKNHDNLSCSFIFHYL